MNIVGRNRKDQYDFYETPQWASRKILDALLMDGEISKYDSVLEPCCGAGAISQVLFEYGFENIMQSDISCESYISGKKGVDIVDIDDAVADFVITNPPYGAMTKEDMLADLLRISKRKCCLLLNIYFLSSTKRKAMLENSHLKTVYIHSDRVTMYPYGEDKPTNGGTKMYAWFLWDKEYNGKPTISWI